MNYIHTYTVGSLFEYLTTDMQLSKYLNSVPFVQSNHMFIICGLRFEIVDQTTRLLVPIIVLQNHNRYNILEKGHNYSINIEAIEAEVSFTLCLLMTYVLKMLLFFG